MYRKNYHQDGVYTLIGEPHGRLRRINFSAPRRKDGGLNEKRVCFCDFCVIFSTLRQHFLLFRSCSLLSFRSQAAALVPFWACLVEKVRAKSTNAYDWVGAFTLDAGAYGS